MIEIIPNWHPVFVHFTVALISVSALCYFVGYFSIKHFLGQELLIVGRWCLWFGALVAVATVIAGFIAYYSVSHDTPSHEMMTTHRNWAVASFVIILTISAWSVWFYLKNKVVSFVFVLSTLIAFSLVSITAWHGAELVYRYGLGVMSLPKTEHSNQPHDHGKKKKDDKPHTH